MKEPHRQNFLVIPLEILLLCAFVLTLFGGSNINITASVICEIAFGWGDFATRVLPKVNVRWEGVLYFAFFFFVATITANSLFSWIHRSSVVEAEQPRKWKVRWTVVLLSMVLIVFAVGLSFAGVVHQIGWIATSPSPWLVSKIQTPEDQLLSGYVPNQVVEGPFRSSWLAAITPYLPGIVEVEDYSKAWNDPTNEKQFKRIHIWSLNANLVGPIKSTDGFGLAHFAANPKIIETANKITFAKLKSGTSNTYIIGECNAGFVPWGRTGNTRKLELGLQHDWSSAMAGQIGYGPTLGRRSTLFAMCDGTVREVNVNIDPGVLEAMNADPLSD